MKDSLQKGALFMVQDKCIYQKAPTLRMRRSSVLFDALGGNRTPILRTGILRAIRCTTSADMRLTYYMSIYETLQV